MPFTPTPEELPSIILPPPGPVTSETGIPYIPGPTPNVPYTEEGVPYGGGYGPEPEYGVVTSPEGFEVYSPPTLPTKTRAEAEQTAGVPPGTFDPVVNWTGPDGVTYRLV